MLDSIFIGTSGLQTYAADLKVVGNNVANLNTPGFKARHSMFASLYESGSGEGTGPFSGGVLGSGGGVGQIGAAVDFSAGDLRQTGNPLDLSIKGDGFFISTDGSNRQHLYSRAGQFEFNSDGVLVVRGTDRQVVGLNSAGAQTRISLSDLRSSPPKATTNVKMTGNLSSSATTYTLGSIQVFDAVGGAHTLSADFSPKASTPGTWVVKISDGGTVVASGEIQFLNGIPSPTASSITFSYAPKGVAGTAVSLDFSGSVTSFDSGTVSSLAVDSANGYGVGTLSQVSFGADGVMNLSYTNGQKAMGAKVALAVFDANSRLQAAGADGFSDAGGAGVHIGQAGQGRFGSIGSSQLEGSNVELASEFSDLIVAQRAYQASSRIVSTANELIQDLLDMKGHR